MATDSPTPQSPSPPSASKMTQEKRAQDKQEHDKMEEDELEHDTNAHVTASDPMSQEQSHVPPPAAPLPANDGSSQEDHVEEQDEAQEDSDCAVSDTSEEYYDIHDDDLTSPIEGLSEYGPGGFHPVHLGDTLGPLSDPSRFRVLHKLGHGGFGTVWLCRDTKDGKPKAVKILCSYASEKAATQCPDFKALELLTGTVPHEEGLAFSQAADAQKTADNLLRQHHIALPVECFWLPYQPNGSHLCLITPFLGPNLESFCATYGHVTDLVKHVCFQLVEAMHFMHQKGLCHGDFRPANILFCLKEEVDKMSDDELVEALGGVQLAKLTRSSDSPNPNGQRKEKDWPKELPRYFVGQADLLQLIRSGLCASSIAVIDFGVSYPITSPPSKGSGIPLGYASPEDAITTTDANDKEVTLFPVGPKSDIFALGITLSELVMDYLSFADSNDKLYGVKQMEMVMGPIPEPFRSAFRKWYKEIWGPTGTALQDVEMVTDPSTGETVLSPLSFSIKRWREEREFTKEETGWEDPIRSKMGMGLETLHTKKAGAEIQAQWETDKTRLPAYNWGQLEEEEEEQEFLKKEFVDVEVFADLLMRIFRWMPEERAGTEEVRGHEWFEGRGASAEQRRVGKQDKGQGTFGLIRYIFGFPFRAGKFFFGIFSRLFGFFARPLWFLRGGRLGGGRRGDVESQ